MPTPVDRSKAQALYLKELYTLAKQTYKKRTEESPKSFPFPIDPQGRVILEVQLNDDVWKRIYRADKVIAEEQVIQAEDLDQFKQEFKAKLGHPIQDNTSVSFDLQTASNEDAHKTLSSSLTENISGDAQKKESILKAYQGLAKGRIISLQQETHLHAHLIGRMLNTAIEKGEAQVLREKRELRFGKTDIQLQKGLDNALLELNKHVIQLQAEALETAYDKAVNNYQLDDEKFATVLNEELDQARKKLLPDIAKKIRTQVIKATGIKFNQDITQHLSQHLAEATSGSANDFVHIDKGTGFISFIGSSEHTSHHQELGTHLADRMMYSHHLKEREDKEIEIVPLSHRQQVRIPSIALKNWEPHPITREIFEHEVKQKAKIAPTEDQVLIKLLDFKEELTKEEREQILNEYQKLNGFLVEKYKGKEGEFYTQEKLKWAFNQRVIDDTIDKLNYLQDKYTLGGGSRVKEDSDLPQAFIYNLYTTLNKTFLNVPGSIDERKNKQSQSAQHILEAAHAYNRKHAGKPFCFVQNIAVNGWGYALSIDEGNSDLVNEAAVMTHMASLHTIYKSLAHEDQLKVKKLFDAYTKFLRKTDGSSFYHYLNTKKKLDDLKTLKEHLKILPSTDSTIVKNVEEHRTTFTENARAALASLFKESAFGSHENAFTYQALSVFVEQSSIGGCKSANERAQAVNGRVSILDFVSLDKKTRDELLDKFLSEQGAKTLKALADQLEAKIYERNRAQIIQNMDALYGSLNLEGFQAVISFIDQGGHAKLGTKVMNWDTNYSETVKTHVDKASVWQCHKGLTENVLKEFCGIEEISYSKEAKALGASILGAGAALVAAFVFPPLGVLVGLGIGTAACITALVALISIAYKAFTADSKTTARFTKIQEDNEDLVRDAEIEKELALSGDALKHLNKQEAGLSKSVSNLLSQSPPLTDQLFVDIRKKELGSDFPDVIDGHTNTLH